MLESFRFDSIAKDKDPRPLGEGADSVDNHITKIAMKQRTMRVIAAAVFAAGSIAVYAQVNKPIDIPKTPEQGHDLNVKIPDIKKLPELPASTIDNGATSVQVTGGGDPPPPQKYFSSPVALPDNDRWRKYMDSLLAQWDATSAARDYIHSIERARGKPMDLAEDFSCFVITDRWNTKLPQAIIDDFAAKVVQKVEEHAIDEVYKATQEQISKLRMNAFRWYNLPSEKQRRQQVIDAEESRLRSIHEEARKDATKHLNQEIGNGSYSACTIIELCSPNIARDHNPSSTIRIKQGLAFRQLRQSSKEGSMDSVLKEKK